MTRPDDIPADVWKASIVLCNFLRDERCGVAVKFGMSGACQNAAIEAISKAIADARSEQREEDARIAEGFKALLHLMPFGSHQENEGAEVGQEYAADEIAAAIRNGGK